MLRLVREERGRNPKGTAGWDWVVDQGAWNVYLVKGECLFFLTLVTLLRYRKHPRKQYKLAARAAPRSLEKTMAHTERWTCRH